MKKSEIIEEKKFPNENQILIFQWLIKIIAFSYLMRFRRISETLIVFHNLMTIYLPVEIYLTTIFLILMRIERMEKYLRKNLNYDHKITDFLCMINNCIESINKSLSVQVLLVVVELLTFALTFIYSFSIIQIKGTKRNLGNFVAGAMISHLYFFQISYLGAKTQSEVSQIIKLIHFVEIQILVAQNPQKFEEKLKFKSNRFSEIFRN